MHQVYEVNVRTWASARSAELGRRATLDDFDDERLDRLVEDGFSWIYLLGVWPTGPLSVAASRQDEHLRHYLSQVLSDFTDDDITGSVFAPAAYVVDDALGGEAALRRFRDRARAVGLRLMLDFMPNQVGLDHPWVKDHPDWFVPGTDDLLWSDPCAYVRLHGHVLAHGRDPFFPPWRSTVQFDYSNTQTQDAVIREASAVAGRCDALRCDMAMLLLPDVFEHTWRRPMQPFWKRCLDHVRAEHPGTLFMAEVYWNREWDLQQLGFDYTYDKILYDRLRDGNAEAVRAHLRATLDYQNHCVRFLENHEEARAATVFSDPAQHRAALIITGMVPGMLLCHEGQEDGRRIHNSLHAMRRPDEMGAAEHAAAFAELLHLLSEPARKEGRWRLLEPRSQSSLIGMCWQMSMNHALVLVVNYSNRPEGGSIDMSPLADRNQQFQDRSAGNKPVLRSADELRREGMTVQLPAWGIQVWRVVPQR